MPFIRQTSYILLFIVFSITASCSSSESYQSLSVEGFSEAATPVVLPSVLNEVSGIAYYPATKSMIAINDEKGVLYVLNKEFGIEKSIPFAKGGDYEDIVIHNDSILVLKSNGDIFLIKLMNGQVSYTKEFRFKDTKTEFETLVWDYRAKQFLLISKRAHRTNKHFGNRIYVFNPATASYKLSERNIPGKDLKERTGLSQFHPSAAAMDTKGNLFILSAIEGALIQYDKDWNLVKVVSIDKKILRQPEGMAFDDKGNLYITSEASGRKPVLILLPALK